LFLTDTHCHLDLERFDSDRADVLERAEAAGVGRILIPGLSVASSRSILSLVKPHPMLYAAIGVHPTEALTWAEDTRNELRAMTGPPHPSPLSQPPPGMLREERGEGEGWEKIVAIGEIGLDYYWEHAPHERQRFVLREQLDLAAELDLPVIIHLREQGDADHGPCSEHTLEILEAWVDDLRSRSSALVERPGVLHSFSGSLETARQAITLGFFIGVSGPVTYKNARSKQEMVAQLPLERLLIETDAPFLAPHPHRGKRNEPAYVTEIPDKIAQLQSRTLEQVAQATTANAARLFSWGEKA
jgi:TatD DNase family protein